MEWSDKSMMPNVKGLLEGDDRILLYTYAQACVGNALEIGSYRGGSTVLLAQGLKDGHGDILISVDPYDNRLIETGLPGTGQSVRLFNRYNKWVRNRNIKKYGVNKQIMSYYIPSYDIVPGFADNQFGLIFIDGDHSYPAVKTDMHICIPKLRPGGILFVHDKEYAGVCRAVEEEVTSDVFSDIRLNIPNSMMSCIACKRV